MIQLYRKQLGFIEKMFYTILEIGWFFCVSTCQNKKVDGELHKIDDFTELDIFLENEPAAFVCFEMELF